MEYIILEENNRASLSVVISEYADMGWKLQGGVAVTEVGFDSYYRQAMVKD